MAEDDTYDLMPHRQIEDLKKHFDELKKKSISSQEMLDSMNKLTATMDSMLKLFTQAAEELKLEEKEESETAHKVDSIVKMLEGIKYQNNTIAEGVVTVSDMIKEHREEHKEPSSLEKHGFGKPSFGTQAPEPSFQHPESNFQQPLNPEPSFKQLNQTGPVPMPSIPFPELEKEPKKKGLFGRLKK